MSAELLDQKTRRTCIRFRLAALLKFVWVPRRPDLVLFRALLVILWMPWAAIAWLGSPITGLLLKWNSARLAREATEIRGLADRLDASLPDRATDLRGLADRMEGAAHVR